MVDRENKSIAHQGWPLLDRFSRCHGGLKEHKVYRIEASMEEVVTFTYLHHAREKGEHPLGTAPRTGLVDYGAALTQISHDIKTIDNLPETTFHALLVRGRILTRLKKWDKSDRRG